MSLICEATPSQDVMQLMVDQGSSPVPHVSIRGAEPVSVTGRPTSRSLLIDVSRTGLKRLSNDELYSPRRYPIVRSVSLSKMKGQSHADLPCAVCNRNHIQWITGVLLAMCTFTNIEVSKGLSLPSSTLSGRLTKSALNTFSRSPAKFKPQL